MKNRVAGKKFSRNTNQRKALLANLIRSFFSHGYLRTTETKADVVARLAEKMISKGREKTVSARRILGKTLQDKELVNKIVDELGPLFKNRKGGFIRATKLGKRLGDKAMMVRIELVEKPEEKKTENRDSKKSQKSPEIEKVNETKNKK